MDPFADVDEPGKGMPSSEKNIIPFGKYRGKPVEVLLGDAAYTEWLRGQGWVAERFPAIHTLIINNFGDPSETPEHNALQLRFLDDTLCRQACRAWIAFRYSPPRMLCVLQDIQDITFEVNGADVQITYFRWFWDWKYIDARHCVVVKEDGNVERWERLESDQKNSPGWPGKWTVAPGWKSSQLLTPGIWEMNPHTGSWIVLPQTKVWGERFYYESSRGYVAQTKVRVWCTELDWHSEIRDSKMRTIALELKPSLGDDYPACLRKMLAPHGAQMLCYERWGSQMPASQVRQLFAKSGKLLCSLDELMHYDALPQQEPPPLLLETEEDIPTEAL